MDKSLDDIIKNRPRKGNGRRRPGVQRKADILGTKAPVAAAVRARKVSNVKSPALQAQNAEKIMVSGLPADVNEQQIRDLFAKTVGPIKELHLVYNANGRWSGSATVVFRNKGDGSQAYERYNNRLIDGRKPMKIELMYDPAKTSLVDRVAPATTTTAPMEGVQRTGGRPRRGRGGRTKRNNRPPKSAEDLDAEMEDYSAATSGPAAAAAAPAVAV